MFLQRGMQIAFEELTSMLSKWLDPVLLLLTALALLAGGVAYVAQEPD